VNIPLVDLKIQYKSIEAEVKEAIGDVLDQCSFIGGPIVESFEDGFAHLSGAKFAVGASSGTTALHVALEALGIGAGDEVITVANTFAATVEAIVQTKATVRFVDIDSETFNMDVALLQSAINTKTKAIVPVHLYGQACDMDEILALAKKYNLHVINDACQAHLATYKEQPLGGLGDCTCYSFFPGKNLGAYGDAGGVVTNDRKLAERIRMLVKHGITSKYVHKIVGYNYRLDTMQAAVLNVKLKYIEDWTKKRQVAAKFYTTQLKDLDLITPVIRDDRNHVFHLYVIRIKNRDEVFKSMQAAGVGVGMHYPVPLHLQEAFVSLGYKEGDFPVTERVACEILSLPMFPEITEEQLVYVCDTLKESINV
jgi:dTDP-4-amino-4,6-dideoxygalactose transaminase